MSEPAASRLLGQVLFQGKRLVVAACFFFAPVWLVPRLGRWPTILLLSLMALGLCAWIAGMLRRVPPGEVRLVNRMVPIVLPLGLNLGRGKLWPIVACSWAGWTIIAAAGAFYAGSGFALFPHPAGVTHHAAVLHAILIVSLILDGLGFCYLANLTAKRLSLNSPGLKPMLVLLSILLVAIGSSIFLSSLGHPTPAAMVAGFPPLIVGGFYGSYLLMILIFRPRLN